MSVLEKAAASFIEGLTTLHKTRKPNHIKARWRQPKRPTRQQQQAKVEQRPQPPGAIEKIGGSKSSDTSRRQLSKFERQYRGNAKPATEQQLRTLQKKLKAG